MGFTVLEYIKLLCVTMLSIISTVYPLSIKSLELFKQYLPYSIQSSEYHIISGIVMCLSLLVNNKHKQFKPTFLCYIFFLNF
jgi:hypothetical protein